MDVVLLKDIERLGKEGAVVHVKPGFARNFLLPKQLALPATPQHLKQVEARQRHTAAKAQRARKDAESLKQKLESRSLTMKLTLGEEDKPFGSVTAHDLLQALAQDGIVVEKHAIQLDEPLKALGIYDVPIRMHPELTATLKVWIVKA